MIDLDLSDAEVGRALRRLGYQKAFLDDVTTIDDAGEVERSMSALTTATGDFRPEVVPLLEAIGSPREAAEILHRSPNSRTFERFHLLVHDGTSDTFAVVPTDGRFRCRSLGKRGEALAWLASESLPLVTQPSTVLSEQEFDSETFVALLAASDLLRQRRLLASLDRANAAIVRSVHDMDLELQIQLGWESLDVDWAIPAARLTCPLEFTSAQTDSPVARLEAANLLSPDATLRGLAGRLAESLGGLAAVTLVVQRGRRTDSQLGVWCCGDAGWQVTERSGHVVLAPVARPALERAFADLLASDPLEVVASTTKSAEAVDRLPPKVGSWFWVDVVTPLRDDHGIEVGALAPGAWFEVISVAPDLVSTVGSDDTIGWIDRDAVQQDG